MAGHNDSSPIPSAGSKPLFFWEATSGLEDYCFSAVSLPLIICFSKILLFGFFFFFHRYLDCLLTVSSCCTLADHGWCLFQTWFLGTQLQMTWEGLAFKGQALILTWNSYVLSDWSVGLNRSGSWVSPGLKMSLAPLEPIATSSKHF